MSVYKRKSGKWAARIDVGRNRDGRRLRRALGTYATRKDAERAERKALEALDRGIELLPRTTTLANIVDRFLADVRTRLEAKTVERYGELARLHIVPRLGTIPVGKLRAAHVSELYAHLLKEGSHGRRLSPRTVHHVHRLLHRILSWAERMQLVERNVTRLVDAPKPSVTEAKALTADEVDAILVNSEGSSWQPFFALAYATGARRGELLALTWDDIDIDAGKLMIRRSLVQTRGGTTVKSTKTDRVRLVPLSRPAVEALRRVRSMQAAERLAAGPSYVDGGYVFAGPLGEPHAPHAASDAFRFYARRCRISTAKLHSLRHTAATLMIAAGKDIRTVAGILGHSTPSTTLNVYGHLVPGYAASAVDALADELEQARSRRMRR